MTDKKFDMYDDVIVGAGSAGAVIASRLSEDPDRRVLLLEAGADYPAIDGMPPRLVDSNVPVIQGHHWLINALLKEDTGHVPSPTNVFEYGVGKVTGGSSSVNATLALRGIPEDYDEWAAVSGGRWSWQDVLQDFRDMEDDVQGAEALHGCGGLTPIRRERKEELAPLQKAFMDACMAQGFSEVADMNHPESTGVGIIPRNTVNQVRMSTALCYLAPARGRANLDIVSHAHARRINWRTSTQCEGVEVEVGGEMRHYRARRIILCSGALNTPALLMRSGVGDPAMLEPLGIRMHMPLPGVGANLIDHPSVALWAVPKHGVSVIGEPAHQAMLRYTSSLAGSRDDMNMFILSGIDTSGLPMLQAALGSPIGMAVAPCIMKPVSVGYLRLVSADPSVFPRVVVNCCAEREDIERLKEGARLAWKLLHSEELGSKVERIFAWTGDIMASDAALESATIAFTRPMRHPVGTARMGISPDSGAVVDPSGRVHGMDNLWIADASIMPTMPSAPTNLTCIMAAERIARELRAIEMETI